MTQDEYLKLNPEMAVPRHHGQPADRGQIIIGKQHSDEGYAVLRCGNTSVLISYTILHHMQLDIWRDHIFFRELHDLQNAIYSITCEAGMGRVG